MKRDILGASQAQPDYRFKLERAEEFDGVLDVLADLNNYLIKLEVPDEFRDKRNKLAGEITKTTEYCQRNLTLDLPTGYMSIEDIEQAVDDFSSLLSAVPSRKKAATAG